MNAVDFRETYTSFNSPYRIPDRKYELDIRHGLRKLSKMEDAPDYVRNYSTILADFLYGIDYYPE